MFIPRTCSGKFFRMLRHTGCRGECKFCLHNGARFITSSAQGNFSKQRMTRKPLSGAELNELVAGLNKLAHNLWWTWNQEAQDLFQELSPRAWQKLFHNAVAVLREVSDYE